MKVLILGQPGAGTGIQAARVSQILGIPELSVGALLRAAIDEHTRVGCAARGYVAEGRLVPDSLVVQLLEARMARSDVRHRGFVLDGFPRNIAQLQTLLEWLRPAGIDLALELSFRRDVGYERRRSRDRADDDGSVIRQQFEDYRRETEPMIATLRHAGRLLIIDANRGVGDVTAELLRVFRPPRFTNECRHDSAPRRPRRETTWGVRRESSAQSDEWVQPATTASRGCRDRSEVR